ncbi:MAG: hypothetical protein KC635_09580 [Myxococcales bacterium]|nr:hypothetical protein [Myxococcales bacterium]MCB9734333.1 hypothetical protein [Deltaproteobacteria bacterium]
MPRRAALLALLLLAACGDSKSGVDPVEVDPPTDSATTPPDTAVADSALPDDTRPPADTTGAGPTGSGLWVEDANGQTVGWLVRRGSDDSVAHRVIYDIVTVYHPESGLFFEVTMSDGVVRFPNTVYFTDYACANPVGVAVGSCTDCKSAYDVGFRHAGKWWRMRGGVDFELQPAGSTLGGGLGGDCVSHGTSNAKGYPVDAVTGPAPPLDFAAPLRFVFR